MDLNDDDLLACLDGVGACGAASSGFEGRADVGAKRSRAEFERQHQQHQQRPSASSSSASSFSATSQPLPPKPASYAASSAASASDCSVEEFSKLKIRGRTVPSADVRQALVGRTVHKVRALAEGPPSKYHPAGGADGKKACDWITIGVLSHKNAPSLSKTGKAYGLWTLTDFFGSVTVFLFGDAYEALKREAEGGIFLVSCPVMLPASERHKFALSVSTTAQLCKLGTSPFLGTCKALRKNDGMRCTAAVNTEVSLYCPHHMAGEYSRLLKEVSSGRGDVVRQTNSTVVQGFADGRKAMQPMQATKMATAFDGVAHAGSGGPGATGRFFGGSFAAAADKIAPHKHASDGSYSQDTLERAAALASSSSSASTGGGSSSSIPLSSMQRILGAGGAAGAGRGGHLANAMQQGKQLWEEEKAGLSGGSQKSGYYRPSAYTIADADGDDGYGYSSSSSSSSSSQANASANPLVGRKGAAATGVSEVAAVRIDASGNATIVAPKPFVPPPSIPGMQQKGSGRPASAMDVLKVDPFAQQTPQAAEAQKNKIMALAEKQSAQTKGEVRQGLRQVAALVEAAAAAASNAAACSTAGSTAGASSTSSSRYQPAPLPERVEKSLKASKAEALKKVTEAAGAAGDAAVTMGAKNAAAVVKRVEKLASSDPMGALLGYAYADGQSAITVERLKQQEEEAKELLKPAESRHEAKRPRRLDAVEASEETTTKVMATAAEAEKERRKAFDDDEEDDEVINERARQRRLARGEVEVRAQRIDSVDGVALLYQAEMMPSQQQQQQRQMARGQSSGGETSSDDENDDEDDDEDDFELELVDGDSENQQHQKQGGNNKASLPAAPSQPAALAKVPAAAPASVSASARAPVPSLPLPSANPKPQTSTAQAASSGAAKIGQAAAPSSLSTVNGTSLASSNNPLLAPFGSQQQQQQQQQRQPSVQPSKLSAAPPSQQEPSPQQPAQQQQRQQLLSDAEVELLQLERIPEHNRTFAQSEKLKALRATLVAKQRMLAQKALHSVVNGAPMGRSAAALSSSASSSASTSTTTNAPLLPFGASKALNTGSSSAAAGAAASGKPSKPLQRAEAPKAVAGKQSAAPPAPPASKLLSALSSQGSGTGMGASLASSFSSSNITRELIATALTKRSINEEDVRRESIEAALAKADKAERLEEMEEAMANVHSRKVTRWFCADCEKWFDKQPLMCMQEQHAVTSAKKDQFAYRCGHCSKRVMVFDKLYHAPCAQCGHTNWEQASVFAHIKPGSTTLDKDGRTTLLPTGEAVANSLRTSYGGAGSMVFAHEVQQHDDGGGFGGDDD